MMRFEMCQCRHHVGTPGDIISECPGDFDEAATTRQKNSRRFLMDATKVGMRAKRLPSQRGHPRLPPVSLWGGVYRVDAQSEVTEVILLIWVNIPQSDVSRRVNRLEIAAWAC
jgi:hypothetical protein